MAGFTGQAAVVLDSPHSGTEYPADFEPTCPMRLLRTAEDTHVDDLYSFARTLGVALVCARFPRSYIDANRAADEIDEALLQSPWPGPVSVTSKVRLGKGLVWRVLDDGLPVYARRLSVEEVRARIDRCWIPYHRAVDEAVESAWARHGQVIHLNCHSMPSVAGALATEHPGEAHPDFVLGDLDHSTADGRLTRWIGQFLVDRGHTVAINHPYKGVELVRRHGDPARRRHSIQIEVNRKLYMDEVSLEKHEGYEALRATLRDLVKGLCDLDLRSVVT